MYLYFKSFQPSHSVLFGYSLCDGPETASVASHAVEKERKAKAYFVLSFHIWHMNNKMWECFNGITNSEQN